MGTIGVQIGILVIICFLVIILAMQIQITGAYREVEEMRKKLDELVGLLRNRTR